MPVINYADAINELCHDISEIAASKGFWDIEGVGDNGFVPMKLALAHSELSEALEAHRKAYDDDDASHFTGMTPMQEQDFSEELADCVIRCFDIAGGLGLNDFGEIMIDKIEKNRDRPHLHGKKRY